MRLALLALLLLLPACAPPTPAPAPPPGEPPAPRFHVNPDDPALLNAADSDAQPLTLDWPADLPPPQLPPELHLQLRTLPDDDRLIAGLRAGEPTDLLLVPDTLARRLLAARLLQPLPVPPGPPLAQRLRDDLAHPPYDPDNTFTLPLLHRTAGLAWRADALPTPPAGWEAICLQPELEKHRRLLLLPDPARDLPLILAAALLHLHQSPNTRDPALLAPALALATLQRDYLLPLPSGPDPVPQALATGAADLALAWDDQAARAAALSPQVKFTLPPQGAIHRLLCLVRPLAAPASTAPPAARLLDQLLTPATAQLLLRQTALLPTLRDQPAPPDRQLPDTIILLPLDPPDPADPDLLPRLWRQTLPPDPAPAQAAQPPAQPVPTDPPPAAPAPEPIPIPIPVP